jgi:hypothetical protein
MLLATIIFKDVSARSFAILLFFSDKKTGAQSDLVVQEDTQGFKL